MRRTNNDIFRQLEELTVENEQLKKESKELRAENRWLRTENARQAQRFEAMKKAMEDRMKKAVEEAAPKVATPLLKTIKEKDKEITRLKSRIAKLSSKK